MTGRPDLGPPTTSCSPEAGLGTHSDQTAQAAIGAVPRELRLPTIRTEANTACSIAAREHQSILCFLAGCSPPSRRCTERRRHRRITEAIPSYQTAFSGSTSTPCLLSNRPSSRRLPPLPYLRGPASR